MPINVASLSSCSSATSESLAKLVLNIRRNAIKYVKKCETVKNHEFEDILLAEPTLCSQCHEFIFLFPTPFGKRCKLCKLTSHQKCLARIDSGCINNSKSVNLLNITHHKFKSEYFLTPTYCKHCGVMIKGFTSKQGLKCSVNNCKMTIHYDCQPGVCYPCGKLPLKKIGFNMKFYSDVVKNLLGRESSIEDNDLDYWASQKICIEDFDIIGLLGVGSFSKVYLGKLKRSQSNEEFAIKAIKKNNPAVNSDPVSILTEMRVLNLGRNHPFLTTAHCCFQSKDRLFFVMEYVVGRDLVHHISKEGKFTEARTRFYSAEIVLALIFLHRKGFIHRDLKLENVILDKYGHCKLLDFGLSKELTQQQMTTRTFCGTPSYMSPEVIRESDYSFSVDWWALGVLMFEMLSGYSPFDVGDDEQLYKSILEDEIQFPRFLSEEATSMLGGFLSKDPHIRLGCNILDGCEEAILEHKFFLFNTKENSQAHQWAAIEARLIKPPYIPTAEYNDRLDLNQEDFCMTPVNSEELDRLSQNEFSHFSYYSEHFKSIARLN